MKALLFINGEPPKQIPDLEKYNIIACTDGSFHYLKKLNFPFEKLDFISGDFDSHSGSDEAVYQEKFIHTPGQDKTDFEKALEILFNKNIKNVDVYGGSGGEMDHFLGNLTVAFQCKNEMSIQFFDEHSTYFFAGQHLVLHGVKEKMISLYPFPKTEHIVTKGLNWELNRKTLDITSRIGTRNYAVEDQVEISYQIGDLLVFVGEKYL